MRNNKFNELRNEGILTIIETNNKKMQTMINNNPNDLFNNDEFRELFLENLELYRLAKESDIKVPYFSFMEVVSTTLGYDIDKKTYKIIEENKLTKKR